MATIPGSSKRGMISDFVMSRDRKMVHEKQAGGEGKSCPRLRGGTRQPESLRVNNLRVASAVEGAEVRDVQGVEDGSARFARGDEVKIVIDGTAPHPTSLRV